jgi:integrase
MPNLAAVVTAAQAGRALRFFWERAGGKASVHAGQIAGVVLSIARHWAKLPDAELARLKTMSKRIAVHQTSMTARNRTRLRAVDDPERLQALLMLPERIRSEVVRDKVPTQHQAQRLQTAVAIELLTMAPVRIKNLAELRIGVNLLRDRQGEMTLSLPEMEVKNSMAIEIALPATTARLIDLYLEKYRPLLGSPGSPWLFPGRAADSHKTMAGLRQQIERCLAVHCGLVFNPHLFRHFAAKLILEANPGAHGQVQRILGQKSIKTALTYYTGLETGAAFDQYDNQVLQLRSDGGRRPPAPASRDVSRRGAR